MYTFIENKNKIYTDIILTELESVSIVDQICVNSLVKGTWDILDDAAKTTFDTYMKYKLIVKYLHRSLGLTKTASLQEKKSKHLRDN